MKIPDPFKNGANVYNYPENNDQIPKDAWTKVKVHQYLEGNKYYYSIYINDIRKLNVENTTPRVFKNMKVYVCGPGRCNNPEAKVRNLRYKTISECKFLQRLYEEIIIIIYLKSKKKYNVKF